MFAPKEHDVPIFGPAFYAQSILDLAYIFPCGKNMLPEKEKDGSTGIRTQIGGFLLRRELPFLLRTIESRLQVIAPVIHHWISKPIGNHTHNWSPQVYQVSLYSQRVAKFTISSWDAALSSSFASSFYAISSAVVRVFSNFESSVSLYTSLEEK